MKKVAIITLNGYFNYGNRLQNYALQEVIKDLGFEVETIINSTKFSNTDNRMLNINKFKGKNFKELYRMLSSKIEYLLFTKRLNQQRTQIFKEFTSLYINETDFSISEEHIPNDLSDKYDFFVTGSDQVWNPYYRKGSFIEFLMFAPPEKRITYAPSFGVSDIPQKYVENYKIWLSEIKHLSVREDEGANIIKDLTGKDALVVLDPTMILTKEKWLSISKAHLYKPKRRYLLTYFLGNISNERMKLIKNIAAKNNFEIVHLAQPKYKIPYLTGPSEFLDYINSASVFCTDSFHGAVFSILFETPFIVFNRADNSPSMNSRIRTLVKTFKLESRLAENIQSNSQIFEVDYSHVTPILEKEREKSLTYLKQALNVSK